MDDDSEEVGTQANVKTLPGGLLHRKRAESLLAADEGRPWSQQVVKHK